MATREGFGLARSFAQAISRTGQLSRHDTCLPVLVGTRGTRSFGSWTPHLPHCRSSPSLSLSGRNTTSCLLANHVYPLRHLRFNSSSAQPEAVKADAPLPIPTPTASPASSSTFIETPSETTTSTVSPPSSLATIPDTASILKLVSLAKPQWRLLTVGVVCLVISTGVNLTIPWVIGRIIDFFTPGSEATLLLGFPLEQATALLAVALLIGAAANSGRSIALRLSGQRTSALIR